MRLLRADLSFPDCLRGYLGEERRGRADADADGLRGDRGALFIKKVRPAFALRRTPGETGTPVPAFDAAAFSAEMAAAPAYSYDALASSGSLPSAQVLFGERKSERSERLHQTIFFCAVVSEQETVAVFFREVRKGALTPG